MILCLSLVDDNSWHCKKATDRDHTNFEGVYEIDRVDVETRHIKGIVTRGGSPLSDVLVEIYDHPEKVPMPHPDLKHVDEGRRRLAACYTNEYGKYCFHNIPPGKYEIRFSKPGFNTHSLLSVKVVKKKTAIDEQIDLELYLSL